MLKLLIVEDDAALAATLKYLVEDNPRYHVVALCDDADSAVREAAQHRPDLALVDLKLANNSTGYSAAVRLADLDVPCLFVTGRPPNFAMPELALGCLIKPFTAEDVHRSLAVAEDVMRGREALRPRHPSNLMLYEEQEVPARSEPGFIPSKRSLCTRIEHWLGGKVEEGPPRAA